MSSTIRKVEGNMVEWVKGDPKRDIQEEYCSQEEAIDRIKNSDIYKNVIRFTLEEKVKCETSPNGFRWVDILNFLDGDILMSEQSKRKWETLKDLFLENFDSSVYEIDKILHRLHRGNIVIRLVRKDNTIWKGYQTINGESITETKDLYVIQEYPSGNIIEKL